jgi:hypothetical protein
MPERKTTPLEEKLKDLRDASSLINRAVKACVAWDHHDNVEQAIEKMREAQRLLKAQYEEWGRGRL